MRPNRTAIALVFAMTVFVAAASAETHRVSDIGTLTKLLSEMAEPGDVIEIQPGVYYAESKRIQVTRSGTPENPIVIRGIIKDGKRPVIDAGRVNIQRGVLQFEEGSHDIIMENLEICNAAGYGRSGEDHGHNAAAVRFLGSNITIRNCRSHDNENGFFASHQADYILIENCEIDHNGTRTEKEHSRTHNFYFCAQHQIVRNCYIHHPRDGENFKSRGDNTIFAYNWVDEDYAYAIEVASGGRLNTLWLGNVIAKRTELGMGQGRLLCLGDGTGVAEGRLVVLNNTFITTFPRDYYIFSHGSATGDIILLNNAFAGPGKDFLQHNGKGTVTGRNNWIQEGISDVPGSLENTIRGDDPGFMDMKGFDFRLKADSPLADAGAAREEYQKALTIALEHARSGTDARPSPAYLKALAEIESSMPAFEPLRKGCGFQARKVSGPIDIGAFEAGSSGPAGLEDLQDTVMERALDRPQDRAARMHREQIELLRRETLEESLVNLHKIEMYYRPGYTHDGTKAVIMPLEPEEGGVEFYVIMSNRRVRKVLQELSNLSDRAAADLVNREIERALADYDEAFKPYLEKRRTMLAPDAAVPFSFGFRMSDNPDGTPTLMGIRWKVLALAAIAAQLGLSETGPAVTTVAERALAQRRDFYDETRYSQSSGFQMLTGPGIYNRQILAAAIARTSATSRGVDAVFRERGIEWKTTVVVPYDYVSSLYTDHTFAADPADAPGAREVRHLERVGDDDFEAVLEAARPR